ncbi:MAG: (Fe-S)-binding protein [Anaerolineae bacterium]|nr:(Fe-S)-binding protein [Anaerolineae bacterium]
MALKTARMTEELELFGCIQCGKCTGGCPVARKTTLNIRDLIYHMMVDSDMDLDTHAELWDCTACFTCVERCPKDVQPAELIIALRGELVEGGRIPETIGTALMSIFRQGNPSSMARQDRDLWAEGMEASLEQAKQAAQDGCDLLYFVGCIPAYDNRVQPVARALMRVLESAGLDVGALGTDETCCGNEVRRMGEVGLFEMLVEENGEMLRNVGADRIVTTSPHCFNTFKNEYGLPDTEILHYTQLVAHLLEEGDLTFGGSLASEEGEKKVVTYHDPCFLGKQNQVYDEPRAIIKAIPGVELVEMDRSRERSLCCEGGGGRMWVEGTNLEERIAFQRVQEAADTGADILAVACPFCLLTLEDAVKVQGLDEQLRVMDIMELVDQVLEEDVPDASDQE